MILIERTDNKNSPLKTVDLAAAPHQGDKVVIDIDGVETIFKVIDVHYAEHLKTDVIVARLSSLADYNDDAGLLRA